MNVELHDTPPANPQSRWELFVYACYASNGDEPNGTTPAEIDKMLRTATFPNIIHG